MTTTTPTLTPTAREITGAWPARAQACRDNPEQVFRVYDGDKLRELITSGTDPHRALVYAQTATVYLRWGSGGTCYAVTCEYTDGSARVWYGTAGGHGYDKAAAALEGHGIGKGLIATDHCGLDRRNLKGTDLEGERAILVTRNGTLPRGLFVI